MLATRPAPGEERRRRTSLLELVARVGHVVDRLVAEGVRRCEITTPISLSDPVAAFSASICLTAWELGVQPLDGVGLQDQLALDGHAAEEDDDGRRWPAGRPPCAGHAPQPHHEPAQPALG